jgi:hypothetical protein
MAIGGIVFRRLATAMARNRAIGMVMAVVLEEEGDGEGRKIDGDNNKEGNGKQR